MAKGMLFPVYLSKGAFGSAVDALQLILCSLGIGGEEGISRDGKYGPETLAGVKSLQNMIGGCRADGCFGPMTVQRLEEVLGISVRAIPANETQDCVTYYSTPDMFDGQFIKWDPINNQQTIVTIPALSSKQT